MAKTPTLPLFAQTLGASPVLVGVTVMASTIPGILVSLPAGLLSDRIGTKPLLLAALFVFATAPFFYLLVHTITQLALIRFYHGFATAIFGTIVGAEIAFRYPARRGHALGVYSSVSTVGRSLAPFLGGTLISLAGFPAVFISCGVAGILAFMLGIKTADDSPSGPQPLSPAMGRSLRTLFADRIILTTSLVEALQYFVFGSVEAFLALYTARQGWEAWRIGVLLGVQLGVVVLLKPLLGALSDRRGRRPVTLAGLVIGAVAVALIPFTHAFWLLFLLNLFFGLGFAGATAATSALVADRSRAGHLGASIGLLRSVMDIGQASGPVITGALIEAGGYRIAFTTLGLLLLAAAILFFLKVPRSEIHASGA